MAYVDQADGCQLKVGLNFVKLLLVLICLNFEC